MTTSILWMAFIFGFVPETGLSSEDFDKFFAEYQRSKKECGPTAVYYCLRRLGREATLEEVKQRIEINANGASLQSLLDVLQSYNVSARALRAQSFDVRLLPCPCILVIGRQHCVVLERIEPAEKEATIFEPAYRGFVTLPIAELTRQCSGEIIVFADPDLELPLFATWTICSLILFLSVCLGIVWIGDRVLKSIRITAERS